MTEWILIVTILTTTLTGNKFTEYEVPTPKPMPSVSECEKLAQVINDKSIVKYTCKERNVDEPKERAT